MGRSVQSVLGLVVVVTLVMAVFAVPVPRAGAAEVCEPETLADLAEPEPDDEGIVIVEPAQVLSQSTDTTSETDDTADTTPPTTPPTTPSTTTAPPEEPPSTPFVPSCDTPFVYTMTFPIVGNGGIGSPFGADRDGGARLHAGVDLFAPALQPVVAVADGTVARIAGDRGISGNMVIINHSDGWSSFYIHLNNDTAGTDDARGVGIRPDLEEGDPVEAGELIGWVGDSGNAETTEPHLHFELHDPAGDAVNPGASLTAAKAERQVTLPEGSDGFVGPFADLSGDTTHPLSVLLSRGYNVTCDGGFSACPSAYADASQVGAWFVSHFGAVSFASADPEALASDGDAACQSTSTCLEAATDRASLECDGPCSIVPVTEAEMTRALAWLLLQSAYEQRVNQAATSQTDDGAVTEVNPPPAAASLDLDDVHVMLNTGANCSAYPDTTQPLTREAAAQWIIDRIIEPVDQCDPHLDRLSLIRTR